MRLHYKIRGEAIRCCDVMSLYRFKCKYFKFPVEHTVLHVGDAYEDKEAMLRKEELKKCLILPPKCLYHSILQFRCNNRLLFCLCRTCATEQNTTTEYTHETVVERAFLGTWELDEARLAVQKDYQIIEVYEVYEYNVTQYDPTTGEGGTFARYKSCDPNVLRQLL